jgi:hypothetical protein
MYETIPRLTSTDTSTYLELIGHALEYKFWDQITERYSHMRSFHDSHQRIHTNLPRADWTRPGGSGPALCGTCTCSGTQTASRQSRTWERTGGGSGQCSSTPPPQSPTRPAFGSCPGSSWRLRACTRSCLGRVRVSCVHRFHKELLIWSFSQIPLLCQV